MGMVTILFSGAEPVDQSINILRQKTPCEYQLKTGQAISEKKTFKDYLILYIYIAQGQGKITLSGHNFDYN